MNLYVIEWAKTIIWCLFSANLFSFNEDQLKKKAQKLSENCRNNVRPDAAKCVEKAANKWKANIRTERLQSNECMALWSIICKIL